MATESIAASNTDIYNKSKSKSNKIHSLTDIGSSGSGKNITFKILLDKAQRLQQQIEDIPKGKDSIRVVTMVNNKDIIYQKGQIHDSIHGSIWLSNLVFKIIDTSHYQRLRSLKQLGSANQVYPNATHSRFEHSLGVYDLASRILTSIRMNSDSTSLDNWLSEVSELNLNRLLKVLKNLDIQGFLPHHMARQFYSRILYRMQALQNFELWLL